MSPSILSVSRALFFALRTESIHLLDVLENVEFPFIYRYLVDLTTELEYPGAGARE